jgi:hypothetical protein
MEFVFKNKLLDVLIKTRMDNKKSNQYQPFYSMQYGKKYGTETSIMNELQKVVIHQTKSQLDMENRKQKWYQKEFWDNTYERKYNGDFEFYKRLNKKYNNLQSQAIRFNNEGNRMFIAGCLDEMMLTEWEITRTKLWRNWSEKRFELNHRCNYETKCCWDTMVKNAKQGFVDNCIAQIKKGLKNIKIDEQIAIDWLKDLMKWERNKSDICDIDTQRKIYCVVRKDFLPVAYLEKQKTKPTDEENVKFMEKCKCRMGQILFKAAMNIGNELISQVSDDEILDDIELLNVLISIDRKIQEPFEKVEDPEID